VSRRAKFCHHCATALVPEQLAGDETGLSCPACGAGRHLRNRQIGDVAVLECDRCAGLWLGSEPFKRLAQRASSDTLDIDRFVASDRAAASESAPPGGRVGEGWRYRKCPLCGKMMHRRNYGHSSGVIIDACKDHGIWFDADELPRLLAWIRSGKEAETEKRRAEQAAREKRIERRIAEVSDRGPLTGGPMRRYGGYRGGSPLGGFLEEIIEGLFGLG
jgi:Zn-finger nucleic acid-binding protein